MAFRVHIVNIATLTDRAKYMIDVSFGGDGATSPLLLKEGHITQNVGTQELRLVYDSIPQQNRQIPQTIDLSIPQLGRATLEFLLLLPAV